MDITGSKSPIDYRPPRNFDVSCFYGDFSNADKLLGWKPKHTLYDGLKKTYQWFIENTYYDSSK
jgi:dTDP-glucose 4,6-dehydratase